MGYLADVWAAYKSYRSFKSQIVHSHGMLPSITYMKYRQEYKFEGKKVLNLGCGRSVYKAPNVVNMDLVAGEGVDVAWDMSKTPLPFANETFDFIIANHIVEHIPNWFECFKDLARVLKVGGRIEVWVPPVSSDAAYTYRDHINLIGLDSFAGCKTHARAGQNLFAAEEVKEGSFSHFRRLAVIAHMERPILAWWTIIAPHWLLRFYSRHLRNTVSEEGFVFLKV